MRLTYSEANIAAVLPPMRGLEFIQRDIASLNNNTIDGITSRQSLEIERAIKEAEILFRNRAFTAALDKYREARAKIYKILYPSFNVNKYVHERDQILPQNPALHKNLVDTTNKMSHMLIPAKAEQEFYTGLSVDPAPDTLTRYFKSGIRENKDLDTEIHESAMNGISLMQNKNFKTAIEVMEPILQKIETSGHVGHGTKAAMELNLSSAYFQTNNLDLAAKYAAIALENFSKARDEVGRAQAFHVSGLIAGKRGDAAGSTQLLKQASQTLKRNTVLPPGGLQHIDIPAINLSLESASISKLTDLNSTNLVKSSTDTATLQGIRDMQRNQLTYRVPGRNFGWGTVPIDIPAVQQEMNKSWNIRIASGAQIFDYAVGASSASISTQIQNNVYESRKAAVGYKELKWHINDTTSTTAYLSHLYSFTLPVKIGDCYAALGKYGKAEEYYLQATTYAYLNKNIEGVQLWLKLARNILDWANVSYKNEDFASAKNRYEQIIGPAASVPASYLYTNNALSVASAEAQTLIQNIATRPLPVINAEIANLILTANSFLLQLDGGLDYYGLLLSPIHTFEYLQSVARSSAQQASQAEKEFINFKGQEENETAARLDLETTLAMAQAETAARLELWRSAQDDESAANAAVALATKRRDNAVSQRAEYAAASFSQVWGQAASMALSGGEDAYYSEIKELVDRLNRGETIEGPGPKLAAAVALRGGLKTREYELGRMQNTIDELSLAITIAQNQLNASRGRTASAEIAYQASIQRQGMAEEAMAAFDDEFFTPDAWSKMADVMRDISRSFLFRAIRIAKLMERAYNFDNDSSINIIKSEYGFAVGNSNNVVAATLLGGESLLNDIDSFTYNAIASKTRKSSRIKDSISLAANFPLQFEVFKNTGLLSFETDLYEFDRLHPGFYEQRIEVIELEIVGVVPGEGLNGTFRAGGVTRFRKKDNTESQRVHQIDTAALSDFSLRNDIFLYSSETGVRGLFQGFGLGSTFELHLPKRSNDFDFRRIFDINLVIYYTAKYDEGLKDTILALPVRPGEMAQLNNFSLRYDFPDAWYGFYKNGNASFAIEHSRLPFNQRNFKVKSVSFRLITKPGFSNAGAQIKVTSPNGVSQNDVTDVNGVISSTNLPLSDINGQDPLNNWSVEILNAPSLMDNGVLKFDRVYNIQMGLEYSFEYVDEIV